MMTDRISIPALRDKAEGGALPIPQKPGWDVVLALVEAVEAAYRDANHRTGCVVCGNLHGHADDCPGARFDFGDA
jgi:hypothetical protein